MKLTQNIIISSNTDVSIGNNTLIAEYVSIRDSDHGTESGINITDQPLESEPVRIGSDVWIGAGSIILN